MTTAPTAPAQTKHKRRKRQGFLTLSVISLILFVIFAVVPSAVGTFIGAVMVGAGGMVMVGIRFFQQNAAREVEETREAQEAEAATKQVGARAPWGSSVATKIVGWVRSPSVPIVGRKKRQASAAEDSKREQSATDPAKAAQMAEAAKIRKAIEAVEDLGFGLLGVGGLIVAASALPGFIQALFPAAS